MLEAESAFLLAEIPDGQAPLYITSHVLEAPGVKFLQPILAKKWLDGEEFVWLADEGRKNDGPARVMLFPVQACSAGGGVLGFVNSIRDHLSSPDLKLGKAIAEYAGAQLENFLINQANVKFAKLEAEMELAQQVQNRLLPKDARCLDWIFGPFRGPHPRWEVIFTITFP